MFGSSLQQWHCLADTAAGRTRGLREGGPAVGREAKHPVHVNAGTMIPAG